MNEAERILQNWQSKHVTTMRCLNCGKEYEHISPSWDDVVGLCDECLRSERLPEGYKRVL